MSKRRCRLEEGRGGGEEGKEGRRREDGRHTVRCGVGRGKEGTTSSEVEGDLALGEVGTRGSEEGVVVEVVHGHLEELLGGVVDAPDGGGLGVNGAIRKLAVVEGGGVVGSERVGVGGDGEDASGGDLVHVDMLAVSGKTVVSLKVVDFVGLGVVDEKA